MSDPKEPFEAAVRAGCNALYPIAKCPFPESEACQRHCAEEVAFAKAVLAAALPPDPAPLEVMRDDGSYVTEEDVLCTLRAFRASLLLGEEPS